MARPDGGNFEHIWELAARFDRHMDQDNRVVSWEEMRAELEVLSEFDLVLVLGLVKTMKKADGLERKSSTSNSVQ